MDKIEPGIAAAAAALPVGGDARRRTHFAAAIRTTDKHAKKGALEVRTPEGKVKLGLRRQGLRHDQPQHGDHALLRHLRRRRWTAPCWTELLHGAVDRSFNRITVDGQESTNDTVLGLCNGASGVEPGEEGLARLGQALDAALLALALSIVADGEGSTRTMKLTVTGAQRRGPGRGRGSRRRQLAARQDGVLRPRRQLGPHHAGHRPGARAATATTTCPARIAYEDVVDRRAAAQPAALGEAQQGRLAEIMHQPEIDLNVALNGPGAEATVYFSDLTHDYVTLNAEYST